MSGNELNSGKVFVCVQPAKFALREVRNRFRHAVMLHGFHSECLLDEFNLLGEEILCSGGNPPDMVTEVCSSL
ncbi:MAG: hypothetical protein ABSE55_02030 [Terracidiphilus sp.]